MKIYCVSGQMGYVRPFLQSLDASLVDNPEDADVLWFCGGEDVDPAVYGAPVHHRTSYNPRRSYTEDQLIKLYPEKFKIGTCRGLQQFHASSGGHLIQHTDRHAGPDHEGMDVRTGEVFMINSVHHQAVMRDASVNMEVVMTTPRPIATVQQLGADTPETFVSIDVEEEVEAAYYPDINAFGVQWHPEWIYGGSRAVPWFLENIIKFYSRSKQAQAALA